MAHRPARLVISPHWSALVHALCWVTIVAAAGVLALQLTGDRVGRVVTPAQALTAWVVPMVFVASVAATLLGRHLAAIAGSIVAILFLWLVAPLAFPRSMPAAEGADRLTVVHANLLYSNPHIDHAIQTLLSTGADVIALSELTPEFADAIDRSTIGDRYPHRLLRPGDAAIGLGIWSRAPLTAAEPIDGSTMTLTADVDLGGEPIRIVLAHPLPPLFNRGPWRAEIAAMTANAAADRSASERTLLVGDLNVSFFHPPYRQFLERTGMRDVHQALGAGFSVSWPTDEPVPPFVRLDHALAGDRLTATAIDDIDLPGSDHRAFVVTIGWAARDDRER